MNACQSCGAPLGDGASTCSRCAGAADLSALPTMTPSPVMGAERRSSTASSESFDHGRFAPGTIVADRYRIVARLGMGGMGEVFRADDLTLGQPVALKFLPESLERDPVWLDRFTAEVRTARQIAHPNVCRVYDVGDVDGRRFLSMEYVDGEDLKGLLRRIGRLPEDKGLEIARQICAGLGAMHDRGVLHRDLKPANIMLDGRGRVRLTDFGLATALAGAGLDGEVAGTPAYMAPEQLAGQPLSTGTDLFALGLVLFELFTGERLQKGDTVRAIRELQRAGKSSALSATDLSAKLDPVVRRVIERCLETDTARRPQSAVAVAAALPGGNPLAAALAAGETPSPAMVAAAGEEGGLSLKIAVPLLVLLVLGVALAAWQEGRGAYSGRVPFPHSPEVLASKATEMLTRLGYTEPVVDRAMGFGLDNDYARWVEGRDNSATRWQGLESLKPAPVRFWHRTSPAPMDSRRFFGGAPGGGIAVTSLDDPPFTTAGMTYLELDPEGRLVALEAAIPDHYPGGTDVTPPDWPVLFREAGLDPTTFEPTTPEWVGRAPSDARAAWTFAGSDAPGAPLRVEAAAFRGRPVYFRLVAPWTKPERAPPPPRAGGQQVQLAINLALLLGVPMTAIVFSLRNLRLGRVDTRGAVRLAVVGGCVQVFVGLLGSDLPDGYALVQSAAIVVSSGALSALMILAFYSGIEPFVRRHWPQMLISWTRLLDGRWRDPLLGRDLIVGSVLGHGVRQVVVALQPPVAQWVGSPPLFPDVDPAFWVGIRLAAAEALTNLPRTVLFALGIVVLLVVFRILLRREWAVALAFTLILVAPAALAGRDVVLALLNSAALIVFGLVATRFGLVMAAAYLLASNPAAQGGGFAAPDFAMSAVYLCMAIKMAPGVFGFFTSTRGQRQAAWLDGE